MMLAAVVCWYLPPAASFMLLGKGRVSGATGLGARGGRNSRDFACNALHCPLFRQAGVACRMLQNSACNDSQNQLLQVLPSILHTSCACSRNQSTRATGCALSQCSGSWNRMSFVLVVSTHTFNVCAVHSGSASCAGGAAIGKHFPTPAVSLLTRDHRSCPLCNAAVHVAGWVGPRPLLLLVVKSFPVTFALLFNACSRAGESLASLLQSAAS